MSYTSWHRVLAHALLAVDPVTTDWGDRLGRQSAPDLAQLAAILTPHQAEIEAVRAELTTAGRAWPVPPTPELAAGLPWAQYLAALGQLQADLGLTTRAAAPHPTSGAGDDPETRRLRADRPPHW